MKSLIQGAGGVCAIHQPNLFPRLSTLTKLYAADRWIVLDNVQFARRDYQHRARLAALDDPDRQQWLTLPTHLPHGRSTLISQARLADPRHTRRTVELLAWQYYGRSHHWPTIRSTLDAVLGRLDTTDRVARWKGEWQGAQRTLQRAENEAAEREGRTPVELRRMVTHDLRHFFASALIAGGASVP